MKRILIVYDTKGGTTREIIGWIRDGAVSRGAAVDIADAARAGSVSLNYDLIVAGSPIYGDHPMASVLGFLGRDDLRGHSLALFVVCYAGVFGMRNFMVRRYLDELQYLCKGKTIYETSFDAAQGPWRKLNREICIDFGRMLAGHVHRHPAAIETA
jgi:menaquinone-dependent protoporphyrinogen oxidase